MSRNYKNNRGDDKSQYDERKSQARSGQRSKKKGNQRRDKNSKPMGTLPVGDRDNDPNWYFTDPHLADQASQLSFQNVLGFGDIAGYKVPSVMKVPLVSNPGLTYSVIEGSSFDAEGGNFFLRPSDGTTVEERYPHLDWNKAGVNIMAAKLYTTLSSFTGRTASYAPQDVAMMILAISSIAEFSEHIRRVFGLALTYNYRNRSLPLGIIHTMGINVPDLISNMSVYRMKFNVCMARINQIPLLENIAFIKKCRDIYQKVYVDDTSNMSQIFYFCPAFASVLDEVGDDNGSILRAFQVNQGWAAETQPMSAWLDFLNLMITNVLESSTLNFIYADLLNMANKLSVQTWKFDYLAENYVVMPEYDGNALMQLHNLDVVGYPTTGHSAFIHTVSELSDNEDVKSLLPAYTSQNVYVTDGASVFCDVDKNNIVYNPVFTNYTSGGYGYLPITHVVDMPTDNPSVVDRIEALRFKAGFANSLIKLSDLPTSLGTARSFGNAFVSVPDHYATSVQMFNNVKWEDQAYSPDAIYAYSSVPSASINTAVADYVTKWEHGPLYVTVDPADKSIGRIFGDLKYYTTVNGSYIKRLLDIITVGLFDFRV